MYLRQSFSISIEGPEGSGKSIQIVKIQEYFESRSREVLISREPGGVKIAEAIRHVILDNAHTEMDGRTEALLYAAARRQHLVEKIIPALESGKVIILDRFIDSSLSYQGYARGIGIQEVLDINRFAIGDYMPDLTLYIDVSPEVGLSRIHKNDEREVNRLDLESLEFHKKVQDGYRLVSDMFPERIVRINGEQSIEDVTKDIIGVISSKFNI